MTVDKFSVSLPADLLAQVDELAADNGVTRSALIREATTEYMTARRSREREAERRAGVDAAIAAFDRIADDWGSDERTAADLLRELRDEDAGEGVGHV